MDEPIVPPPPTTITEVFSLIAFVSSAILDDWAIDDRGCSVDLEVREDLCSIVTDSVCDRQPDTGNGVRLSERRRCTDKAGLGTIVYSLNRTTIIGVAESTPVASR